MNSSEQAYIRDLTALALANPEMINEGTFCAETFDEDYEQAYMNDLEIMRMALDDAIRIGDKEEAKEIQKDIQRYKTRQRMARKLNNKNKTIKDLLIT